MHLLRALVFPLRPATSCSRLLSVLAHSTASSEYRFDSSTVDYGLPSNWTLAYGLLVGRRRTVPLAYQNRVPMMRPNDRRSRL